MGKIISSLYPGKQRSRKKATNLETGFPKILTKNVFFSFEKLLLLS